MRARSLACQSSSVSVLERVIEVVRARGFHVAGVGRGRCIVEQGAGSDVAIDVFVGLNSSRRDATVDVPRSQLVGMLQSRSSEQLHQAVQGTAMKVVNAWTKTHNTSLSD